MLRRASDAGMPQWRSSHEAARQGKPETFTGVRHLTTLARWPARALEKSIAQSRCPDELASTSYTYSGWTSPRQRRKFWEHRAGSEDDLTSGPQATRGTGNRGKLRPHLTQLRRGQPVRAAGAGPDTAPERPRPAAGPALGSFQHHHLGRRARRHASPPRRRGSPPAFRALAGAAKVRPANPDMAEPAHVSHTAIRMHPRSGTPRPAALPPHPPPRAPAISAPAAALDRPQTPRVFERDHIQSLASGEPSPLPSGLATPTEDQTTVKHRSKHIRLLALAIMALEKGRKFSTGTSVHRKRQMSTLVEKEGHFGPALTVSACFLVSRCRQPWQAVVRGGKKRKNELLLSSLFTLLSLSLCAFFP